MIVGGACKSRPRRPPRLLVVGELAAEGDELVELGAGGAGVDGVGRERGPRRDIVLMNAAAALAVGARARDLKQGAELAAHAIDTGAARTKLDQLTTLSRKLADEK